MGRRASAAESGLSPTIIDNCQVNLAEGDERRAIANRIASLSMEFGTVVEATADRLWIDCDAPQPRPAPRSAPIVSLRLPNSPNE